MTYEKVVVFLGVGPCEVACLGYFFYKHVGLFEIEFEGVFKSFFLFWFFEFGFMNQTNHLSEFHIWSISTNYKI